ncbi:hypothetical protein CHRY9390_02964 [Chryseobacterium aquaeductus]|uniref:Lipoprotein n=1 Tax=Chryseobacterium aquaeductus TaxID=2675056 RepID=A0A9N8MQN0_9FLAO|nr:hypothetical protein [Chryseobacterium aquaeductus]CAA7332242.1 hypothetical protein CHRY9390_02964 [Chryseobacterium potabilaquae]CAD7815386.1 hypothetical protein CHRY9390_02964 [Chryseobacterium aquaeductus]
MKKVLLISGLLLIFSCKKESDKKVVKNSVSADSLSTKPNLDSLRLNSVDDIKNEYNKVNSLLIAKKLDSTSFNYECGEKSGTVVFYSDNNDLKTIKHSYSENSHFSSVENYFVHDGKPYFIFQQETVWSFDGGTPEKPETKDDIKENRYYYVNKKLVNCRNKTYTLRSKNNSKQENLSDGESKNCSDVELLKTYNLLIKNKDKKGNIKCL